LVVDEDILRRIGAFGIVRKIVKNLLGLGLKTHRHFAVASKPVRNCPESHSISQLNPGLSTIENEYNCLSGRNLTPKPHKLTAYMTNTTILNLLLEKKKAEQTLCEKERFE